MALTALVSSAAGAGLLLATGAGNQTTSTTITQAQAPATATASETTGAGSSLNASALYAASAPGVVDITSRGVTTTSGGGGSPFGGPSQSLESTATGTGFVVDGKGHIVTAAHVVDGASSITVNSRTGRRARPGSWARTTPPTSPSCRWTPPG